MSLGRVVLFPGLRPKPSKKCDPSDDLQLKLYNNMQDFCSSKCHISR